MLLAAPAAAYERVASGTRWGTSRARVKPEYEDCRRLAEPHAVPLRDVYRAAELAAAHLEQ